jgi:hypothetical protein
MINKIVTSSKTFRILNHTFPRGMNYLIHVLVRKMGRVGILQD